MAYRKTTVEIDQERLRKAQEVLGTHGVKETVNAALHEVSRQAALNEAAEYVLAGRLNVPDEGALADWREPRG